MPLVLVIDDEAALRKLLRRVLEAAGYRVLEAANGRIGMEILMKERPDAVISDILMPEKEGIETIIEIRRALPDAKVIAISGGGAAHNTMFLAAAQKLGAHAAISKPFRTSDLVRCHEQSSRECVMLEGSAASHLPACPVEPVGHPRAIVLDDEPAVGRFVRKVAEAVGFSVEVAVDPDAFQELYGAAVPDVVLVDLRIGGRDGIEQLRFLSAQSFSGPVIFISGFDERVLETAARVGQNLGLTIAGCLAKPVRADVLRSLLRDITSRIVRPPTAKEVLDGLVSGEMFLEYQPIVSRRPREIRQLEALIRWTHPVRGRVMPDDFIPVAEQSSELIDAVTDWVIRQAAREHVRLRQGGIDVQMAVNISALNLEALTFPERVDRLLREGGVPADRFCFEVTETAASRDPTRLMEVLSRLRLMGARLAMDDFGTGYSSLRLLSQLPFTCLKIDRSFVMALPSSRDLLVIARSIADLARNLNMEFDCRGRRNRGGGRSHRIPECDGPAGIPFLAASAVVIPADMDLGMGHRVTCGSDAVSGRPR